MSEAMRRLVITEEDDHVTDVPLEVGEELEVAVPENATTGFEWAVGADPGEVVTVVDSRFEAPKTPAVGASGLRHVVVAARQAGDAVLTLELRRRWERGQLPARRVTVSMTVQGAQ